jgi:hypothetical protein
MVTSTRKPRRVKPASGVTTLTLGINGTAYQVLRLHPHPEKWPRPPSGCASPTAPPMTWP